MLFVPNFNSIIYNTIIYDFFSVGSLYRNLGVLEFDYFAMGFSLCRDNKMTCHSE